MSEANDVAEDGTPKWNVEHPRLLEGPLDRLLYIGAVVHDEGVVERHTKIDGQRYEKWIGVHLVHERVR